MLGIDAIILFLETSELSISYHEASMLYGDFSFLQAIEYISFSIFSQNDFALRLPMILFHTASCILLFDISKKYLRYDRDRLWLILIFILLPGVISSAILVDSASFLIFGLLLFVYLYENVKIKYIYPLLLLYMLADGGFVYLFFSLILFAWYKKDRYFLFFNLFMFSSSMLLYGIDTQGLPEGHFLDAIGIYSAIFTPIVFVYMFYVLYRRYLTQEIDVLWFVSSVALLISLLLSFRQRIDIEHFAPYLLVALPLVAQTFSSSYRVRLKHFRIKYKIAFVLSLCFLFFNSFIVLLNKNIYLFIDNPQKHFAYKMHIAKELATELKKNGFGCVKTDKQMQKRLKFYGIFKCENNLLLQCNHKEADVTISYKNKPIYNGCVTIINNK
jgi:hypothetical protein